MMIRAENVLKIQMTNAVQWWKHYTPRSATPNTGNHTTITAFLMGNKRNITRALKYSLQNLGQSRTFSRLWAGPLRNHSSICGKRNTFLTFPKHPHWLWSPLSLLLSGYQQLFLQDKASKTTLTHILLGLRSGASGSMPHSPRPSWHAQGKLKLQSEKEKTGRLTSCMLV